VANRKFVVISRENQAVINQGSEVRGQGYVFQHVLYGLYIVLQISKPDYEESLKMYTYLPTNLSIV